MADIKKSTLNKRGIQGLHSGVSSMIIIVASTLFLIWFIISFLGINNPSSDVLDSKYGLSQSANALNNSVRGWSTLATNWQTQITGAKTDPISFMFLISRTFFEVPIAIFNTVTGSVATFGTVLKTVIVTNTGVNPAIATGITLVIAGLIITFIFLVIEFIRIGKS